MVNSNESVVEGPLSFRSYPIPLQGATTEITQGPRGILTVTVSGKTASFLAKHASGKIIRVEPAVVKYAVGFESCDGEEREAIRSLDNRNGDPSLPSDCRAST